MNNYEFYDELLGLPNVKITSVSLDTSKINIYCETKTKSCKCPICKEERTQIYQSSLHTFRDLNMGIRQVYLHLTTRQFYCSSCNHYFHEVLDFADSNKSYTHRQSDFMFLVAQQQSYARSGVILDMHAKTVERAVLSKCEKMVNVAENYAKVTHLGIDEQSHKKGKKDFVCVLTDLDRGTIVDILPDRKKETLVNHFQSLGEDFCNKITDISCDNWQTYINVAKECFPKANIILDRFHFTKQLNQGLDKYLNEVKDTLKPLLANSKDFAKLKKIVYIQYHKLSDQQFNLLNQAFEKDAKLKEIYFNREKFHHILDNNTQQEIALQQINQWIINTQEKQFSYFDDFIKSLNSTKEYIANYVRNCLSNAVTEGLNNIIRVIKRFSFGMPSFKNLRLRSLAFFL